MHEYSAVTALVSLLERDPSLARPVVRVRASPVFCAESLQQAYAMATADTSLADTRLEVEEMADRRTCTGCGREWAVSRDDVAGHVVVCPTCGALSSAEAFAGARCGIALLAGGSPRGPVASRRPPVSAPPVRPGLAVRSECGDK